MKCHDIVDVLALYRTQVSEVLKLQPNTDLTVASAYSFITVNTGEFHIQFEISETSAKLQSIHCPDHEIVKRKIELLTWPGLDSRSKHKLPDHVIKYLTTADSVTSLAANCTVGDNYRPGNFSKIIYANTHIELQQVNYMNAKSLDHKSDYSLRSLVFRIPFGENAKMITEFNDRSSENNRYCGDRIQAALDWLPG